MEKVVHVWGYVGEGWGGDQKELELWKGAGPGPGWMAHLSEL